MSAEYDGPVYGSRQAWDWFRCKKCGSLFPVLVGDKPTCPECRLAKQCADAVEKYARHKLHKS